jgi:hypothetical protein
MACVLLFKNTTNNLKEMSSEARQRIKNGTQKIGAGKHEVFHKMIAFLEQVYL